MKRNKNDIKMMKINELKDICNKMNIKIYYKKKGKNIYYKKEELYKILNEMI